MATETDATPEVEAVEQETPETAENYSQEDKTDHSDRPNWEAQARKHEREAKKQRREAEALRKALDEAAEANKSEQEKALDAAKREAAEAAAQAEAQKYRAKILNAEIRAAAASKFADPTDAVALVRIDDDDLFDSDGEINSAAVKSALDALLESKPHLAAGPGGRVQGDADAGKGEGGSRSIEDWSVDEHLKAVQKQRQEH